MSVTDFDVACLMQRGAVVILGIEDEETSKKHTRTQLEEIVARETATLREAIMDARHMVVAMVEWNKAVEAIVGRCPNTGFQTADEVLARIDKALNN